MTTAEGLPEIDWDRVEWRKASACGETACVEVGRARDRVAIRNSRHPDVEPLVFTTAEWVAFVQGVRQGDFT